MRRLGLLALTALLALLIGACTATPITLPLLDGGVGAYDAPKGGLDLESAPDAWSVPPGDFGVSPADAAADSAADGACLECPLGDGMVDGGAGDAEAGPTADALPDLLVGDVAGGE